MKKKLLISVLTLAMAVGLAACGGPGTDGNGKASENGSESAGNNGAEDEADKTDASEESESAGNDGKTESAGGTQDRKSTRLNSSHWS